MRRSRRVATLLVSTATLLVLTAWAALAVWLAARSLTWEPRA